MTNLNLPVVVRVTVPGSDRPSVTVMARRPRAQCQWASPVRPEALVTVQKLVPVTVTVPVTKAVPSGRPASVTGH